MRLIVLAAGHGYSLDGTIKCLIRHPLTNRTFLEHTLEAFAGCRPTVVVGYRAVEIMQRYPRLDYVFNPDWAVSGNTYSLSLALTEEPCCVCSSDMLVDPRAIADFLRDDGNLALAANNENRTLSAINCVLDGDRLAETYVGPLRHPDDPEALGIFKISDPRLLRRWRQNGLKYANLFAGQTLPVDEAGAPVRVRRKAPEHFLHEINTPLDYQVLLRQLLREDRP